MKVYDSNLEKYATQKQWKYYTAAYEQGGVRKGARVLGVNHSTVSDAIKRIEAAAVKAGYLEDENAKDDETPVLKKGINKKDFVSTTNFVITNAICNAPLHDGFYSLKKFAEANNAQLLVIPSVYNWERKTDIKLPDEVIPYLITKDFVLNKNLMVKASNLRPTLANPLSGKEGLSGIRSCIFGHPQIAMKMVATPKSELPRMLHTTGACTRPYYSRTAHGQLTNEAEKGNHNHSIGGLFVKVKGGKFWTRELICEKSGEFYDLGHKWDSFGKSDNCGVEALVLGDIHAVFLGDKERSAIFKQIKEVKPKYVVLHDLHDNYANNHHHRGEYWLNYVKKMVKLDCLRTELMMAVDFIEEISKYATPVLVQSNHHDHLGRWFKETRPNGNNPHLTNDLLWSELHMLGHEYTIKNKRQPNLFDLFLRKYCKSDFIITDRNKPKMIAGVDVSQHGDIGANGTRGHQGFIKSAFKMFLGHSHTPKIDKGAWWVGVMALDMEYARGLSSWFATNGIINKNGKRQLIHIVDGETCLEAK